MAVSVWIILVSHLTKTFSSTCPYLANQRLHTTISMTWDTYIQPWTFMLPVPLQHLGSQSRLLNSLYFNLQQSQLNWLQVIQNSLARCVVSIVIAFIAYFYVICNLSKLEQKSINFLLPHHFYGTLFPTICAGPLWSSIWMHMHLLMALSTRVLKLISFSNHIHLNFSFIINK
jgi:hypothetical protein